MENYNLSDHRELTLFRWVSVEDGNIQDTEIMLIPEGYLYRSLVWDQEVEGKNSMMRSVSMVFVPEGED